MLVFEFLAMQYVTNYDASVIRRVNANGTYTQTWALNVRRAACGALIAAGQYRVDPATGAECKGGDEEANGCTCNHCSTFRARCHAAGI